MKKKRRYRQAAAFLLAAVLILSTGTGSSVFAEAEETEPVTGQEQVTEPVTEPEIPTVNEMLTEGETSGESETETEPVTEPETDAETEPATEPETEFVTETELETQNMPPAQVQSAPPAQNQILEDSAKTDKAVQSVQELIDALPTAEELKAMSLEEQQAVYEQVQAAYDAYNALSDEQKSQITGAEVFDELFAVFNSMTNTLVTVGGFNVEGDSSGYSYSSGILTINNGANLTISTNGQTADRIVVASGATATITLNNVSIATTNNNTPIDVPNNSTLTLNLVNGSQNTISATSSSVTDCGSPGIHVPSGAQLTIQGEGSLSVIGASVSSGSWAGVGIGGRAVGGVQTGEACGTVIILGGNVTVSGGSGGYKTPVGIGGGGSWYGGAGGTVIILNGNVAVTGGIGRGPGASGSQSGANGQGIRPSSSGSNTYDVYGNLILPDGVTLPGNITIYIPEGASLSLPEGASWPDNITITGAGEISPKRTATITIDQQAVNTYLNKTYDGSPVTFGSSGYTYTGDATTPEITITWHSDSNGTIGTQLDSAPTNAGTYWVRVSAAATGFYEAASEEKQFTIEKLEPIEPTHLTVDVNSMTYLCNVSGGGQSYICTTTDAEPELNDPGWQEVTTSGRLTFNNLKSNTTYYVWYRFSQADANHDASIIRCSTTYKTKPAEYPVTIPSMALTAGDSNSTADIAIDRSKTFNIGYGGVISVFAPTSVTLTGNTGTTLTSALLVKKNSETEYTAHGGGTIISFDQSNYTSNRATIRFDQPLLAGGGMIPAGSYTGTMTFTISYSESESTSGQ